jgi:RHS repeat-associated protein
MHHNSTYDAYGMMTSTTGGTENHYLFAGEQFDKYSDNYYQRQRFYNPASGRFIRRDFYDGELGEPPTKHKYIYSSDNPSNLIDPSGLVSMAEQAFVMNEMTLLATTGYIMVSHRPEPLGGFGAGQSLDG